MKNLSVKERNFLIALFEELMEQGHPEHSAMLFKIAQKLGIHNRTMYNTIIEKENELPFN